MATSSGYARWGDRPGRRWYLRLLENLRSRLTWFDVLIGISAAAVFSIILVGLRHQAVPEQEVGQIADQEIRAVQDVIYEDRDATGIRRSEAEASVQAVYQFDSDRISSQLRSIAGAFSIARDVLAESSVSSGYQEPAAAQKELLKNLENRIGDLLPPEIIPVLLRHHFSTVLESKIIEKLEKVLQDGIIVDRDEFHDNLRSGIVVRDSSYPMERPLIDAYLVRDMAAAREYLRQSQASFPELTSRDHAALVQYMESMLFATLVYNSDETNARRALASQQVRPVEVQLKQGQTIVRSGEQITPKIKMQLEALRNLQHPRSLAWQFIGYFLISAILLYSLWRYFVFYRPRQQNIRNHVILFLVIIATGLVTIRISTTLADILSERYVRFSDPFILYYGIPFAFAALLIALLIDVNLGIFSTLMLAIYVGFFYGNVDISIYCIVGCLAGIYSIRQYKDRAAVLKSGLTIGIVNILCLVAMAILRQLPIRFSDAFDLVILALLSGIMAAALASMFLPALESLFKITTDIRLLELSNLNAPILRRLAVEAPGTYHHSLMVATLAEAAAESIGANPLLARGAAYYHDIGKLMKPEYFVENQSFSGNKHEDLSPSMSCLILSNHVKEGLQFAKEAGLPQQISDMIPQHHGTRIMTYFYQKAKDSVDKARGKIVETDFRYPGPKPATREAAIMMMADSVEAASRTLAENPSPAQIQGMIDRLVDSMIADDQFDSCDITLRDIQVIKESFFKIITGIFHHRIEYPGYDFKSKGEELRGSACKDSGSQQSKAT
jgi:cyclic-di-AMP phosphodiesterase PgpH